MLAQSSLGIASGGLSRQKILVYIESQVITFILQVSKAKNWTDSKMAFSASRLRKMARSFSVWRNVYENSFHGTSIMKRDLYYANPTLLKHQTKSDRLLTELSQYLGVHHRSLGVVACAKGLVYGSVVWKDPLSQVTTSAEAGPKLVPTDFELVSSDYSSIVVIEKESLFHMICSTGVSLLANCVLVTAKGYPDNQTRDFIRALTHEGSIPVLVLTDCDPFGIAIFLCFRDGSRSNLYERIPSCSWIGVALSDVDESQKLILTEKDQQLATSLIDVLSIENSPNAALVKAQLHGMVDMGRKAEMEALLGGKLTGSSLVSYLVQLILNAPF